MHKNTADARIAQPDPYDGLDDCLACGAVVDAKGHRCVWLHPTLGPVLHLICANCAQRAFESKAGFHEVSERCKFALCEPAGSA